MHYSPRKFGLRRETERSGFNPSCARCSIATPFDVMSLWSRCIPCCSKAWKPGERTRMRIDFSPKPYPLKSPPVFACCCAAVPTDLVKASPACFVNMPFQPCFSLPCPAYCAPLVPDLLHCCCTASVSIATSPSCLVHQRVTFRSCGWRPASRFA